MVQKVIRASKEAPAKKQSHNQELHSAKSVDSCAALLFHGGGLHASLTEHSNGAPRGGARKVDRHKGDCKRFKEESDELLKRACKPGSQMMVAWVDFGSNLLLGRERVRDAPRASEAPSKKKLDLLLFCFLR